MTNQPSDHSTIFSAMPNLGRDDKTFLSDIFARFPRVQHGFLQFTQTDPWKRIKLAATLLEQQPRAGWLRFDLLPGFRPVLNTHGGEYYGRDHTNGGRWFLTEPTEAVTETVLEHSVEAQELYMSVYNTSPHKQWGMEVMKFHDFAEAIIGDFTPRDPITKDEKNRIEMIALELLTESRNNGDLLAQHVHNCLQIYEGDKDHWDVMCDQMLGTIHQQRKDGEIKPHQEAAIKFFEGLYGKKPEPDFAALSVEVQDIDALHMSVRGCRMIKNNHPQIAADQANALMEEFWTYIDKKLKTLPARNFYDTFRECYLKEDFEYPVSYNHACLYTGIQNLNPNMSKDDAHRYTTRFGCDF